MHTDKRRTALDHLTERVIGCAYEVSNTLGCGLIEKMYGLLIPCLFICVYRRPSAEGF
jgi:hypothetical protein